MRAWLMAACCLAGCGSDPPAPAAGTELLHELDAPSHFYALPFPSDHRLIDGRVDMSGFPNPDAIPFTSGMIALLDGVADGFGQSSGVFFSATAALDDATLPPSLEASVAGDAAVFLIGIDPDSPDYGRRIPVTVRFHEDGGPFGAPNLLSLVPLQGVPLYPRTRYAAVVTDAVHDREGRPLSQPAALAALEADAGGATDARARAALEDIGVAFDRVVGLAAFTTWDATGGLRAMLDAARALDPPAPGSWSRTDVFDEYCVYQTTLDMPVFQSGAPPYQDSGGGVIFDDDGVPQLDHHETARVVVTIPRQATPAGGWPAALMSRTGGGGDRPLVDRGVRDADGNVAVPGSGPALHFTRAGFAGVTVDGPHGGIRNITDGDEQFLIFNVGNPAAMRDNIRQSALELALMADVIAAIHIDTSDCPDASPEATLDPGTLALMGHSMGATIAPLTTAIEPRFRALVLSGAGGSWIENIIHKQSPVAVRPLAEVILYYPGKQRQLHPHDPILSLLQWAAEPADPPVYAAALRRAGTAPHVLMLQGIVDTYILPPIANATSLAFGLDLATPALDATHPDLDAFTPLEALLPFSGRSTITLPATANADPRTAVVVQHPEDPIEDGHEVVFQTDPPKHQYRCFLSTFRTTTPTVPETPCP